MYTLKQIHDDVKVEIPSCMYHMKNLHTSEEEMEIVDPDMKTLLEKDKKIATDIVLLTEELKELSRKLGHTFGEAVPVVSEKVEMMLAPTCELPDGIHDFVISLSPNQPALSAILIAELLKSCGMHVSTLNQKHSSLKEDIPVNFLAAMGGLSGRLQHDIEKIVLTFVWKDDPFCPSLMHSPLLQTRIIGDANIGRYLCRILYPRLYDENNIDTIAVIDKWVDASVQMTNGSPKEKDAVMKSMNSHLGRNDFFCTQHITLADVTLMASLLTNSIHFQSLPKNVKKWYSGVSKSFNNFMSKFNVPESWTAQ